MSALPATLITVTDDLDAVTTVGHEDDPAAVGSSRADVEAIWASVRAWYALGTTPAIQVCLRRNGGIVLNRTIGHGWGNAPGDGPDAEKILATPQTPFCGFSTAKGVAATLMFMLVEQGAFRLKDRVSDHIPEFAANRKGSITIGDVLSHSAGIPFITAPHNGTAAVLDEELAVATLIDLVPSWAPGRVRVYHALTSGLIQRLLVQRATGKRMRDHLDEQVLTPLGFRWNNFGVGPAEVNQVVPSVKTGPPQPRLARFLANKALGGHMDKASKSTNDAFLAAELPSGNLVTTAFELSRFYEILARGGELDGIRIIEPDTLRDAIAPADRIPSLAGRVSRAGFELGARRSKFGRDTESHFGRSGLTTQYGWADPTRGLSGAILTNGKAATDLERPTRLVAQISDTLRPLPLADRLFRP
ncbi:serine hydrolase [Nocardia sp. NPDC058666]|uniref:serine hydrolase n=1 Tax=Nocardia sp. NPDC058666 TaxID=3346587 RepID=UPI00365F3F39